MQSADFWAVVVDETQNIKLNSGRLVYASQKTQPPLFVRENDCLRWMHFGSNAVQSVMLLGQNHYQLVLPYTIYLQCYLLFNASIQSALIVGSGGGSVARFLRHHFHTAKINAIESSPLVAQQAEKYFQLSPVVCEVHIADACAKPLTHYANAVDVALVDLFDANAIPACLYRAEFYDQCAQVLGDQGILVANVIVNSAEEFTAILALIRACFQQQTLCIPVPDHKNTIILAFKQKPAERQRAALEARALPLSRRFGLDLTAIIKELFKVNPKKGNALLL